MCHVAAETDPDELSARDRTWEASRAQASAGQLHRRAAARTVAQATVAHCEAEAATLNRWTRLPQTSTGIPAWAESVAQQAADADPRVTEMRDRADDARDEQQQLIARHARERAELRRHLLGSHPTNAAAQASRWRQQAKTARHDLAAIEALPVIDAAQLINDRAARAEAERRAVEQLKVAAEARATQLGQPRATSIGPGGTGTGREFGPSR